MTRDDVEVGLPDPLYHAVAAPTRNSLAGQLETWWQDQANVEIEMVVPKAIEYGGEGRAVDLIDIGKDLLRAMKVPEDQITEEWATETGIFFYLRGKVGRWTAAMQRGERVSDDTLLDISIYCRMAQRNRAVGGWPF